MNETPSTMDVEKNKPAAGGTNANGCGCGCGSKPAHPAVCVEEKTPTCGCTGGDEKRDDAVEKPMGWIDAILAGPGPQTPRDAAILAGKGLCMGTADIIPGVSGGTIAFISGIYESLLAAVGSLDGQCLKLALRGRIKEAVARLHLRFLIPLLCGIGTALISTASLVHYLMEYHPVPTWSAFFGLIFASIFLVASHASKWTPRRVGEVLLGTLGAYWFTGLIPVETPSGLWFIFLCGMVAICAMILPGISGSFLLLILGKYLYITGALKNPFDLHNLTVLVVFACGTVLGLTGFVRILRWMLAHYHDLTMCLLTGLMIGSMRKVWPWKQQTLNLAYESGGVLKEKVLIERNVWPTTFAEDYSRGIQNAAGQVAETITVAGQNPQWLAALMLMATGAACVFLLEWWSRKLQPVAASEAKREGHGA